MGKLKDLTGMRFGRLAVIRRTEDHMLPSGKPITQWLCQCDCGNICTVSSSNLLRNRAKSCGCYKKEKASKINYRHGKHKTKLDFVYTNMKQRCCNKNNPKYKHYGARGIKICPEWLNKENGFMNFYDWSMANGYNEGLTIDRIDVNGNYEPNNCRWITQKEQLSNRRKTIFVYCYGETLTLPQICEKYGITYNQAYYNYIIKGENNG